MTNAKIMFQLKVAFDSYSLQNQLEGVQLAFFCLVGLVFNYILYHPLS